MKSANKLNPDGLRFVLVLQGGGALGAYQAGVYQALHEHDLVPDWIVGTSIGAINAALLAGNHKTRRLQRLKQFWDTVSHQDGIDLARISDVQRRSNVWFPLSIRYCAAYQDSSRRAYSIGFQQV